MIGGIENKNFDISRRDGVAFKHYQIWVKLLRNELTEHHNLEIFTTGPEQLIEMRRVYAKIYKKYEFKSLYKVMKNN